MARSNFIVRGGMDLSGIKKGLNDAQNQLAGFQKVVTKGIKLALGYVSVRGIASFIQSTTKLASDLTEVQNVVDVTFGSMAKDINDFAKISIEKFGLSELSAKKYSSTMGAMLKSSGVASDAVRDMSLDLTKLSADIASFYNLENDVAFEKIMSGMSGMTKPLKELGINMNIANLKAYALGIGIKKSWEQMSQAEQTMIRYKYLLNVTKDAQGDFARTSGTWANQTKILGQQFDILKGQIGQGFINMLMPAVKWLNEILKKLQVVAQYFKAFTASVFGSAKAGSQSGLAMEGVADALGDVEDGMTGIGQAGKKAAKDIKGSLAGFDEINLLQQNVSEAEENIGMPAVSIPALDLSDIDTEFDPISEKMQDLVGKIKDALNFDTLKANLSSVWDALAPFANTVGEGLLWLWENVLVPFGSWAYNEVVPKFLKILAGAIGVVNSIIEALKPLGQWLWDNFLKPLAEWTGGVIVSALDSIGNGLRGIGDWVKNHKEAVQIIAIVIGSFAAAWGLVNLAIGIWNVIGVIAAAVTTAFGAAVAFLTSPIGLVVLAIGAIIAIVVLLVRHWDDVKKVAGAVWDWIVKVWKGAADWFNNSVVKPIVDFFTGLWDGIKNGALIVWDKIAEVWGTVSSWFSNSVTKPVSNFFTGLWDGVKDGAGKAKNKVSEVWGKTSDWFSENVTGPVSSSFATTWENIKSGFTVAFDFIKTAIKAYINFYIMIVEGFVNGFIKGINFIISALNRISFDIPDWVPVIGGKNFGFNIGSVSEIRLPRLYAGGIISGPTLAMVGDNRNAGIDPEVVSPLSKLRDMMGSEEVLNALMMILDAIRSQESTTVLKIGESEFGRAAIRSINSVQRQTGTRLLTV